MGVTTERQGDVAILTMAGARRGDVSEAIDQALTDTGVRVIVLTAAADGFGAGGGDRTEKPGLIALCDLIESAEKPVVAALEGSVLGDGLDLALACHYRVAAIGTRIGAPGVRQGLIPAGGATQRLPRLCGAGEALGLLLSGKPRAPVTGFLDAPEQDDLRAAALAQAAGVQAPRPTCARDDGLRDAAGFMADVARAREAQAQSPVAAPRRIVGCVEAAILLPFEAGLALEHAAHDDCAGSPAAIALGHLVAAEAAAWDMPAASGGQPGPLGRVAIAGGTARAGELALACLDAGLEVSLVELEPDGQADVLERLLGLYDDAVARGDLTEQARDERLLRVNPEATFDDLGDADIVWEAAPDDDDELKNELWAAIGLLARDDAVLLASGDKFALAALALSAECADRMVGVHIAGPAHTGPLAEIVAAPGCTPRALATALALVRRLGRQAVMAPDQPGRLLVALSTAMEQAADALLVGGHTAETIDQALLDYGFRQPPCVTRDIRGFDRALAARQVRENDRTPRAELVDMMVDTGLTGRRAGAGLYLWMGNRPQGEPPATRALLRALEQAGAPVATGIPETDIAHICAAALAEAGARLLDIIPGLRAGDIDVAAVHGLGFPRWRGGPMLAADQRGLVRVEKDVIATGLLDVPSPLFGALIRTGGKFARLAHTGTAQTTI